LAIAIIKTNVFTAAQVTIGDIGHNYYHRMAKKSAMVTYAGVITLVLVIIMARIGYGYLCWSDYIIFGNE
jgi:hypothetical protein